MQNAASLQQKPTQFKLSKITLQSLSKFNISPTAKLVLLYLIDCYNPAKKYMFPKQETIADKLGISLSSVKRAIKELSKANIIIIELKFSNRYNLTQTFFELLNMTPDTVQNEIKKCQNETNHVITEKELNKKQENNFSFKNLLELSKTDTIAYYQEVLKLLESEKEHLCKIKLGRMTLTDFQKINLDKFIMLNDYEINKINSLEPYHRQENIDIFYNTRIKKIREFQQVPVAEETPKNEKAEFLSMLKVGYKTFSNSRIKLNDFLNRNKSKMQQYKILESELKQ
jgi:DNA-binding Lrp family transcriptional regulator